MASIYSLIIEDYPETKKCAYLPILIHLMLWHFKHYEVFDILRIMLRDRDLKDR